MGTRKMKELIFIFGYILYFTLYVNVASGENTSDVWHSKSDGNKEILEYFYIRDLRYEPLGEERYFLLHEEEKIAVELRTLAFTDEDDYHYQSTVHFFDPNKGLVDAIKETFEREDLDINKFYSYTFTLVKSHMIYKNYLRNLEEAPFTELEKGDLILIFPAGSY
jgi:hypothetical protein